MNNNLDNSSQNSPAIRSRLNSRQFSRRNERENTSEEKSSSRHRASLAREKVDGVKERLIALSKRSGDGFKERLTALARGESTKDAPEPKKNQTLREMFSISEKEDSGPKSFLNSNRVKTKDKIAFHAAEADTLETQRLVAGENKRHNAAHDFAVARNQNSEALGFWREENNRNDYVYNLLEKGLVKDQAKFGELVIMKDRIQDTASKLYSEGHERRDDLGRALHDNYHLYNLLVHMANGNDVDISKVQNELRGDYDSFNLIAGAEAPKTSENILEAKMDASLVENREKLNFYRDYNDDLHVERKSLGETRQGNQLHENAVQIDQTNHLTAFWQERTNMDVHLHNRSSIAKDIGDKEIELYDRILELRYDLSVETEEFVYQGNAEATKRDEGINEIRKLERALNLILDGKYYNDVLEQVDIGIPSDRGFVKPAQ